MAAEVGCRYHRLGWIVWLTVFLLLPDPAWLLEPGVHQTRHLAEVEELLRKGVGHIPPIPSKEELQRQRRARAKLAADLYKNSHEWADEPEVVARANSFAQVTYAAEDYSDSTTDVSVDNTSHKGVLQSRSKLGLKMGCENIPIEGCGRKSWTIKRGTSSWQVVRIVLKGIVYGALFAAFVAISVLTLGMFTTFWAPSAALISTGLIASCQTVMMGSVMTAFLSSTFAVTMAFGITGGLLTSSSSEQAGLNWQQVANQQRLSEDLKWVSSKPDTCNEIVFTGKMQLSLHGVELEADESASDAIFDWCRVMNRHDNGTENTTAAHLDSLWQQSGVMPQTSACAEIERPSKERAKLEPHKWFTCYDLLQMQDEEMTYQLGLVAFNLQRSTDELGETDEKPCSETLFTNTPSSTGLGSMCKKIETLRKESRAKNKLRAMLQLWNSSSEEKATTEKYIDSVVKLRTLRKEEKRVLREMALGAEANPQVKFKYSWTKDGSAWAGPKGEKFFPTPPKIGTEVTESQMAQLKEHGDPEAEVHMGHFKRGEPLVPQFKYRWTEEGSKWAGPKGERLFPASPKIGSEVTLAQIAHLKEHNGYGNPETEVHAGHFERGEPKKTIKVDEDDPNVKYKFTWTTMGSNWAGPKGQGYFVRSPKVGSEVSAGQLETLKKEQGWGNPETEYQAGNFDKVPVPIAPADLKAMDNEADGDGTKDQDQFGEEDEPIEPFPEPSKADIKKHQKLIKKIKKLEEQLEAAKSEQEEHMKKNPTLTLPEAPDTRLGYEDMPGDIDDNTKKNFLDSDWNPGTPGPVADVEEHYESGEIGAAYERVERMKQAEAGKALAMHNCLSVASCQMLRKPLAALQGQERKWTRMGFFKKTHNNILQEIVQRCLGHSALYGPADSSYCKVGEMSDPMR